MTTPIDTAPPTREPCLLILHGESPLEGCLIAEDDLSTPTSREGFPQVSIVPSPTTEVEVAVGLPPAPPPVVAQTLPVTGGLEAVFLVVAITAVSAGTALLRFSRPSTYKLQTKGTS